MFAESLNKRVGSFYRLVAALTLFVGMLVANSGNVLAQEAEDDLAWKFWLGAGGMFLEADDANESGQLYEARLSYDYNTRLTAEVGFGGMPFFEGNDFGAPSDREGTFNGKNSPGENWALKTNVGMLYHLNEDPDKVWDPYLSLIAGMEFWGKRREGDNWAPFAGPGLGVSYWMSKTFAIRGDYSMLLTEDSDAEINHTALVLVHFRWGGDDAGASGEGRGEGEELGGASSGPLKPIYFDYDRSELSADSKQRLTSNADWMKQNASTQVSLEGHCDERGTNEYNLALGSRRARAAYDYLRSLGIPEKQMSTISYGEEFPADPGHTEAAWSKNRRTESLIKK